MFGKTYNIQASVLNILWLRLMTKHVDLDLMRNKGQLGSSHKRCVFKLANAYNILTSAFIQFCMGHWVLSSQLLTLIFGAMKVS